MMPDRQDMANKVAQDRNTEREKSVEKQGFFLPTKRKRKKQDVNCPSTMEGHKYGHKYLKFYSSWLEPISFVDFKHKM